MQARLGDVMHAIRVHADPYLAFMLSRMFWPEFPVPVGVLRNIERPTHDELLTGQITSAIAKQGPGDLSKLMYSGMVWEVGTDGTRH